MRNRHNEMAEQILRSDRVYFEMAATVGVMRGAELAWMPELQKLPGGCVVQRVDRSAVGENCGLWLRGAEASIRNLGGTMVRIYMEETNAIPERDMLHAGFRRRLEIAYLLPSLDRLKGDSNLRLREAVSDEDWRERRILQENSDSSADGYSYQAAEWTLLERRKCRTGGMKVLLLEGDGKVLGSVGAIRIGNLLRCKNITLLPGLDDAVGVELIRLIAARAAHRGLSGVGDLVVAGSETERICKEAGMVLVARLFEWSKPIRS